MCGISGYIGSIKSQPSKININQTIKIMRNRGKDGSGINEIKINDQKKLIFLHTRLSIIDPDKRSNQPFKDEKGIIIFNGMIYNYIEIRKN